MSIKTLYIIAYINNCLSINYYSSLNSIIYSNKLFVNAFTSFSRHTLAFNLKRNYSILQVTGYNLYDTFLYKLKYNLIK